MRFKVTDKELNDGYYHILPVGYCLLQHLLYWRSPIAYAEGRNGWRYDVYDVNDVAIAQGYAPPRPKNVPMISHAVLHDFNTRAFGKAREECDKLLVELVALIHGN